MLVLPAMTSSVTSRPNPFDKAETLINGNAASMAALVLTATKTSTWSQIHSKHGPKMACDRDKWCRLQLQK